MPPKKCSIEDLEKAIQDINQTLLLYAKNKENYDEQRDSHWMLTREHDKILGIVQKCIEEISTTLYSNPKQKDAGFYGVVGELSILKSRFSEIINTLRENDEKRDLKDAETKKEIKELLEPIKTKLDLITQKNIAADAIKNWKQNIPSYITNIVTTIGTIVATYFLIK